MNAALLQKANQLTRMVDYSRLRAPVSLECETARMRHAQRNFSKQFRASVFRLVNRFLFIASYKYVVLRRGQQSAEHLLGHCYVLIFVNENELELTLISSTQL